MIVDYHKNCMKIEEIVRELPLLLLTASFHPIKTYNLLQVFRK